MTSVRIAAWLAAAVALGAAASAVATLRPVLGLGPIASPCPISSLYPAAGLAAGDGFDGLKPPAPVADGRIARLAAVDELDCTPCHREVAEEWAASAHALAWVDELYQEEIAEKKKPEGCWGCHIPVPIAGTDLTQKPAPREDLRDHGVTCVSCHLAPGGEILGPFGAPTEAHRSKQSPLFAGAERDALCATCHRTNIGPVLGVAKDFETTDQASKGRSCVGCHMAPIERAIANVEPGAASREFEKRAGRSHALQTPRDPSFLARAFELRATAAGERTLVELVNLTGHRVPGLIGRSLKVTAEVLAPDGKTLATKTVEIDFRAFVPVDGTLTLELAAVGPKVRVRGLHQDPRLEKPVEFLARELEVAGAR